MREWSVGGQLRPVFQKISIWQDKEGFANGSNYCNNNQPALSYRVHIITKCRTVCYVITLSHCITDQTYFVIR